MSFDNGRGNRNGNGDGRLRVHRGGEGEGEQNGDGVHGMFFRLAGSGGPAFARGRHGAGAARWRIFRRVWWLKTAPLEKKSPSNLQNTVWTYAFSPAAGNFVGW